MADVWSVFGQGKSSRALLPKLNIEVGLLSVMQDLIKNTAVTIQPLAG